MITTFKECIEKIKRYRSQNREHKKLKLKLHDVTAYRQAQGIIAEANELLDSTTNTDKEATKHELADIMVICLDFMIREGWTEEDLSEAIEHKLNLRFGEE